MIWYILAAVGVYVVWMLGKMFARTQDNTGYPAWPRFRGRSRPSGTDGSGRPRRP